MGKSKFALLSVLALIFFSCGTNEPTTFVSWKCTETSILGTQHFSVDVYQSGQDTTIYLFSNFHNITIDDTGDVRIKKNGTKLTIEPSQSISQTYVVRSGSGFINANSTEMTLDYIIYNGQNDIKVQAIFTR